MRSTERRAARWHPPPSCAKISSIGAPADIAASVIVPSRDCSDGLARLMQRLARQTLSERFEVIVVDDGSRDRLPDELTAGRPWPRVVRTSGCNSYAARNIGAELARSPVLAFTDADCLPRSDWLEQGLAMLGLADVVAGQVEMILSPRPSVWAVIDAMLFDQQRFVQMGKAATANLFIPRALFERHGGFDETLPSGGDWDFVERVRRQGARLAFAPAAVVEHPTRDGATAFLRRRWRIERAFGCRARRDGLSLLAFNGKREAVVRRRLGFAVGYDRARLEELRVAAGWRMRLRSAPARWVVIPAVDALAQATGVLSASLSHASDVGPRDERHSAR